jgi:sigma-E factor negative regulatory protein RseB
MESMRILHKVQGGAVRERLVSLNGAAREVIRTNDEVRCYLPDENSVVVEHRKAGSRSFPSLLPPSLRELAANYRITSGATRRIVDRQAKEVNILPKDRYRYGYQLWMDQETGLLLKAGLVDAAGQVIEQFMFTHVEIGGTIPDAAFEPRSHGKDYVWYREDKEVIRPVNQGAGWLARELPPGFSLSVHSIRMIPARKTPVEHLVYSDGLAVVSVFIEKLESGAESTAEVSEMTRIGAVHTRGRIVDAHRVTVVGEVPEASVDLIGNSVAPVQ